VFQSKHSGNLGRREYCSVLNPHFWCYRYPQFLHGFFIQIEIGGGDNIPRRIPRPGGDAQNPSECGGLSRGRLLRLLTQLPSKGNSRVAAMASHHANPPSPTSALKTLAAATEPTPPRHSQTPVAYSACLRSIPFTLSLLRLPPLAAHPVRSCA
jgi:hypothetical protein